MSKPEDIDWNDLRYFLAAARGKSLAGAARALDVEHSTIGRRLTALEEALGVRLLTRGPDGLKLTAVGEQMTPLLEEMERAVLAVGELAGSRQVRVRLATPSGFSRIVSPHLAAFQAQHPGVTIELLGGSRPVDLKRGEADLAIRMGASEDEDLIARKIGDAGWSLYGAASYLASHPAPSDPRHLAGHDVLGFEASLATVPGARWLEQHGAGTNVVMRCRELTDMVTACGAGIGLAVLPCMAAELEPVLERLTAEVLGTSRFSLVYRKEVLVSPAVKAVIQFVGEVMRQYGTRISGQQ